LEKNGFLFVLIVGSPLLSMMLRDVISFILDVRAYTARIRIFYSANDPSAQLPAWRNYILLYFI